MSKRKVIPYSVEELAWIKANCELPRRDAYKLFCEKFKRTDIAFYNYTGLCKRKGWMTGRDGCYEKGSIPENKGKKQPYNANSARTQFKKGNAPHNTKYAGHERVTKDGYIEISIDETNKHTGYNRRYALKHRHLWEAKNGKLSDDMILKCLDGNRQNTDPQNWEAIPRGALPFLNGHRGHNYETANEELRPAILTLAKLRYRKAKVTGKTKEKCS